MGIEVEVLDFGKSSPADMGQVEAALRADTRHQIKAVLTTPVDTASTIKTARRIKNSHPKPIPQPIPLPIMAPPPIIFPCIIKCLLLPGACWCV
jgi:hypothetical protein